MRRINRIVIVLAVIISATTSCTKKETSKPDSLVVALGSSPKTLDPRFATDANGMRIAALLFNSLVKIGPDLQVTGDAAQSWTYKNKMYTFELHPNLTFSNGRPVTKEDILFSFEQYRSKKNPFHSGFETIDTVEVDKPADTFVIKIKLKEFSAKLLSSDLPVVKILPKREVLQAGDDFNRVLIGTGSFKFEKMTANEITLAGRDDHPFAAPKVKTLTFKVIHDDFTRYQKTLKGAIDIAQAEIPPAKVAEFDRRPDDFNVYKYPGLSMTYLLINLEDPKLGKLAVRRALSQAINRDEIIKYKLEGLASEATSILTPNNPFFNKDLNNLPYDIEQAKKDIEKLGLSGQQLVLKTSNSQSAIENGRVLANQLEAIGLKVKLQSYEWGTFYGDIRSGNFQIATMRWVGALDPDIYRIAFHSAERPPGRNRGRYQNKRLDRLLETGLKIADPEKRIEHYNKVQKIILDDLPIIPLWYDQQVAVVHKRVKNYMAPKNGDFSAFIRASK